MANSLTQTGQQIRNLADGFWDPAPWLSRDPQRTARNISRDRPSLGSSTRTKLPKLEFRRENERAGGAECRREAGSHQFAELSSQTVRRPDPAPTRPRGARERPPVSSAPAALQPVHFQVDPEADAMPSRIRFCLPSADPRGGAEPQGRPRKRAATARRMEAPGKKKKKKGRKGGKSIQSEQPWSPTLSPSLWSTAPAPCPRGDGFGSSGVARTTRTRATWPPAAPPPRAAIARRSHAPGHRVLPSSAQCL